MLKPEHRMRRPAEFRAAIRTGVRIRMSSVVVHLARPVSATEPTQVGFVVSKSVGSAVVRNTVRRRLRHLMAGRLTSLPSGSKVVVRAGVAAAGRSSSDLARELDGALSRAGAWRETAR